MKIKEPTRPVPEDTDESPLPVPEDTDESPLPVPEERPAADWAERAQKALEARDLGRRLREGKRVLFPSRHSIAR